MFVGFIFFAIELIAIFFFFFFAANAADFFFAAAAAAVGTDLYRFAANLTGLSAGQSNSTNV